MLNLFVPVGDPSGKTIVSNHLLQYRYKHLAFLGDCTILEVQLYSVPVVHKLNTYYYTVWVIA